MLLGRLALYASLAAAAVGAVLALFGCAVAALVGSGPSPAQLAGIVLGTALAFGLLARVLIARIPWLGFALIVARRVGALLQGRRGP
jgi:hypothetical protein